MTCSFLINIGVVTLYLLWILGREIDEYGNVVKNNTLQLKTIAANVAVERANKKKENPYLAHRSTTSNSSTIISQVLDGVQVSEGNDPQSALSVVDERLHIPKRDMRGRKGLHFIEAGRLVEEAERIKLKEERKIIAGYSSGRKALQQAHSGDQEVSALGLFFCQATNR